MLSVLALRRHCKQWISHSVQRVQPLSTEREAAPTQRVLLEGAAGGLGVWLLLGQGLGHALLGWRGVVEPLGAAPPVLAHKGRVHLLCEAAFFCWEKDTPPQSCPLSLALLL